MVSNECRATKPLACNPRIIGRTDQSLFHPFSSSILNKILDCQSQKLYLFFTSYSCEKLQFLFYSLQISQISELRTTLYRRLSRNSLASITFSEITLVLQCYEAVIIMQAELHENKRKRELFERIRCSGEWSMLLRYRSSTLVISTSFTALLSSCLSHTWIIFRLNYKDQSSYALRK